MRSSKSIPSSLNNNNNNFINNNYHRNQQSPNSSMNQPLSSNWIATNGGGGGGNNNNNSNKTLTNSVGGPTSPICRCRVMYLGSSVPLITKDGLQGIQEPLRKLYPVDKGASGFADSGSAVGIDSWLSVWSNGILIENVDENGREVKRFFKINALHYCAAVKYIPNVATAQQQQQLATSHQAASMYATLPNNPSAIMQQQQLAGPRFLPLDSPYARQTDSSPPIFASILRRTTGIKVLECHAFICKREAAANALVRCCFHAYADTMYAKQIGADVSSLNLNGTDTNADNSGTSFQETEHDFGATQDQQQQQQQQRDEHHEPSRLIARSRSKSIAALNESSSDNHSSSRAAKNDNSCYGSGSGDPDYCSLANGDNQRQLDSYSVSGRKSSVEQHHHQLARDELDWNGNHHISGSGSSNLKKQQKHSKSMHYLNYHNGIGPPAASMTNGNFANGPMPFFTNDAYQMVINPSTSTLTNGYHNNSNSIRNADSFWAPKQSPASNYQLQQQPFYNNPYASRVPSYPPQEQIQMESANGGGTLKSIRSMAANSIASTLLRSKRHAKSMAQLNKAADNKIISFHQPHNHHLNNMSSAHTMIGGPVMLPPVPPMFLPNHPHQPPIMNGSQTMKLPSRSMVPMMMGHHPHQAPMPMNPFETMTPKEMKKLLKKSAKYGTINPPLPLHMSSGAATMGETNGLPPMLSRQTPSSHLNGGDGTLPLRPPSIYSMEMFNGAYPPPDMLAPPDMAALGSPSIDQQQMTPILVKPNQEFLKSKAGKKWLKQQKEFKKLLPPHLDGLPIIFGPPPPDALEPHTGGPAPGSRNLPGCDNNGMMINNNGDNRHRIYY